MLTYLHIVYGCFRIHNDKVEWLQQRLYSLKSLKYLLSESLQKKFPNLWLKQWIPSNSHISQPVHILQVWFNKL